MEHEPTWLRRELAYRLNVRGTRIALMAFPFIFILAMVRKGGIVPPVLGNVAVLAGFLAGLIGVVLMMIGWLLVRTRSESPSISQPSS